MLKDENIDIDLDEKIEDFISENNIIIDLKQEVLSIIKIALNEQNIVVDTVTITIQSMNKEQIRKINNEYRNIDRATDVLSFPIFEKYELEEISKQNDTNKKIKILDLGDIILCLDIIKSQSIEYETGIQREILYMITHGVCHLLGFDHESQEDKKQMRELEEKILNQLGECKIDG